MINEGKKKQAETYKKNLVLCKLLAEDESIPPIFATRKITNP